jgi:hypothetical protein
MSWECTVFGLLWARCIVARVARRRRKPIRAIGIRAWQRRSFERKHTLYCCRGNIGDTPVALFIVSPQCPVSVHYRLHHMLSSYGMDQKRVRKGLALPQAWHAGDVSALSEQGEACELAAVPCARQDRPSGARIHMRASEEHLLFWRCTCCIVHCFSPQCPVGIH